MRNLITTICILAVAGLATVAQAQAEDARPRRQRDQAREIQPPRDGVRREQGGRNAPADRADRPAPRVGPGPEAPAAPETGDRFRDRDRAGQQPDPRSQDWSQSRNWSRSRDWEQSRDWPRYGPRGWGGYGAPSWGCDDWRESCTRVGWYFTWGAGSSWGDPWDCVGLGYRGWGYPGWGYRGCDCPGWGYGGCDYPGWGYGGCDYPGWGYSSWGYRSSLPPPVVWSDSPSPEPVPEGDVQRSDTLERRAPAAARQRGQVPSLRGQGQGQQAGPQGRRGEQAGGMRGRGQAAPQSRENAPTRIRAGAQEFRERRTGEQPAAPQQRRATVQEPRRQVRRGSI